MTTKDALKHVKSTLADRLITSAVHDEAFWEIVEEALVNQINSEADGCKGCAFVDTEEWEMPCQKCKRNCKDYWRAKNDY